MTHAVGELLDALRPAADETALLEACLHVGARAERAWRRWDAGRTDGAARCRALAAARTLLPLLARSAARNHFDMAPDVRAYVHAATLREERRAARWCRIAADALARLDRAAVAVFVVRGAALAASAYPAWSLRHCHDLDLLLEPDGLAAATAALALPAFAERDPARPPGDGLVLRHASGLRIALHTRPFASPHHPAAARDFAAPEGRVVIGDQTARMPAPEATLVHVLGHATYSPSRHTLRWVADAWHLIARWPELDWSDVARRLDAYRLALPVAPLLSYVADLGAGVPPEVLAAVRTRAAAADPREQDVALGGALAACGGDVRRPWRLASWPARRRLVRWAVAPSAAYVRDELGVSSRWSVPIGYAYRPARFAARTLAAWATRTGRDG